MNTTWLLDRSQPEPNTGCWLWLGQIDGHGYPRDGKDRRISRLIMNPDKHQIVMHKCDTPLCVNPAHLRVGTQKENVRDCVAKGRYRNGSGRKCWFRSKKNRRRP